jgi:hypothetical protein
MAIKDVGMRASEQSTERWCFEDVDDNLGRRARQP